MTTVSGLVSAGTDTTLLAHDHHVSNMLSPGDRFVQIVDFDSPAFNRANRVDIPILDMVVDDLWVEFRCDAVGGPTLPAFSPVQTWIGSNGVQLLYKNQSIYTMSEPEAILYDRINPPSANVFHKWMAAQA